MIAKVLPLTKPQQRALDKLKAHPGVMQCAYELQESLATLEALHRFGHATRHPDKLGTMFSPRTAIGFKYKEPKQ